MAAAALLAFPIGPSARLRPRFLPERRRRAAQAAFARPHAARASRRPRFFAIKWRRRSARPSSRARSRPSSTTSASLQRHQSCRTHLGAGRARAMPTFSSTWRRSIPTCSHYQSELRAKLAASYPSTQFDFLPADIVSQILNFGLPSPLDVQVDRTRTPPQPRLHREAAAEVHRHCGRGGPAHPAAVRLSAVQRRRRSQQGDVSRSHRAERRHQSADLPVRQLPDHALLLDRSEERHAVQCGRRKRRNTS